MAEQEIPQHLMDALYEEFKNDHDYDPTWDYEDDARRYITALMNVNVTAIADNTAVGEHVRLTGDGWTGIPGLRNKRVLITGKSAERNELYFHTREYGEMAVICNGEDGYTATKSL